MNNRRVVRIVAIILALIMLFSVFMIAINALTASAVTQAEIDKLKAQKQEFQRQKREIQSRINTIEFEKMSEIARKQVLDDRIMLIGMEIDNIIETIEFYVTLISEKELEVIAAQEREDQQLYKYKKRVRDMEENGVISYLEIIFDSTDFADMLARLDFVGDIMHADEETYYDLKRAQEETEAAKERLEQTKLEMEEEKLLQESMQLELEERLDEANALIEAIEADLESERALRAEVEADEEKIQREINKKVEELRRAQEAARAAAASSAASRVRGTGQLKWPVPSNGSVSSGFGMRMHPVYKVYRQHSGIDIPAKHGANVVAADTGTVITSAYNSSYGNYVVISHGNGVTTLYAHLSSRKVKENATVTKGDVIGLIGSTGVSTGPHLHFEVSVNGSRINPLLRL